MSSISSPDSLYLLVLVHNYTKPTKSSTQIIFIRLVAAYFGPISSDIGYIHASEDARSRLYSSGLL